MDGKVDYMEIQSHQNNLISVIPESDQERRSGSEEKIRKMISIETLKPTTDRDGIGPLIWETS